VRCNEKLKFGPLVRFARAVGATRLATGHYARLESDGEGVRLRRSQDRDKDQSYFLFGVPPGVLEQVAFPLGELTKDEVRTMARRHGLANADKPDSQEICFIPDGDHKGFVETHGGAGLAGEVVDEDGAVIGEHAGTHRFTIGQRRGVPAVGGGDRRFVLRIEAATGRVVVGPRAALSRSLMQVDDVRWTAGASPRSWPLRCAVQIRHRAPAAPAWVEAPDAGGAAAVRLDEPAVGVAPGQAAVFYDGDRVVGGGWIA
jgi:tRNA-specific 2-thiouridylase